ncbi:Polypeptide N-acetylgalactosaminyltransferase 10, partial [Dissostichus eleginoides]
GSHRPEENIGSSSHKADVDSLLAAAQADRAQKLLCMPVRDRLPQISARSQMRDRCSRQPVDTDPLPGISARSRAVDNDSCRGLGSSSREAVNRAGKDAQVIRDGVQRIDWHNYEAIKIDLSRSGHGEQGKAFPLTDADRVDQAYRENGFNIYVSDRISLNRSVPDIRNP